MLPSLSHNIKVSERGKVFEAKKDGVEYNIYVSFADRCIRRRLSGFIEPLDVLRALASLLQDEKVKAKLSELNVSTPCECGKCNGRGIIPAFMYYANGICFDCMGLGRRGSFNVSKASKV